MSDTGATNPGTMADNSAVGTSVWQNPDGAKVSGGSTAYTDREVVLTSSVKSHYLVATNFGFAIPEGSTINGIKVEVNRDCDGNMDGVANDYAVRIVKGGSISTHDYSSGSNWPTSLAYATYGSSGTLWGETWLYSDINASNFGFAISAYNVDNTGAWVDIDHIRITVYYNGPVGPAQISKVAGIAIASIGKVSGVATAQISKVAGVA